LSPKGPLLPLIRGDRRALKQILINVVSNAVKYTPAGGAVVVRAEADPASLSIAVADTGSGIAPEDLSEGRLAFLKAELKITEAQTKGWDAFAAALRDNTAKLNEAHRLRDVETDCRNRLHASPPKK
jgi:light-regulated signal transduction histidine kinase (bacteriophytochrome)